MKEYLKSINKLSFDALDYEMKEYASINNVPIIQDEGLAFLQQIILLKKPKRILEIGTAIGYSAINMAKLGCNVDTIEIKEEAYKLAMENIKKANLDEKIVVYLDDATTLDTTILGKYDMLFIDAAKAQYKLFFDKYSALLNDKGIVVTDNLLFHGLVVEENIESRNLRALVRKIKDYNEWLIQKEQYNTTIYDIGDGMALSIKK